MDEHAALDVFEFSAPMEGKMPSHFSRLRAARGIAFGLHRNDDRELITLRWGLTCLIAV